MNVLGVIPARYGSTRFPGKPLVDINGKPMIQRVYEQAKKALKHVVVATDDNRILNCVVAFGGEAVMTAENHPSGTDRCTEAQQKYQERNGFNADVVVNIQGDEPYIDPQQILQLVACFKETKTDIATLITPITETETIFNPNKVKVITDLDGFALMFSRNPIPYLRGVNEEEWVNKKEHFAHLGMYAYRIDTLKAITNLKPGRLEQLESLEQLRWLENNIAIKTAITTKEVYSVDTPEDVNKLLINKAKRQ